MATPMDGFKDVATFISLRRAPRDVVEVTAIVKALALTTDIKTLEDGPYGGTPLMIGEEQIGEMILVNFAKQDSPTWKCVRIQDAAVAQTAHSLTEARLWLPTFLAPYPLPVAPLENVGQRGFYDMNIAGNSRSAPFTKAAPSPTATYPCLWNHDAKKETRMVCEPDSQLLARPGMEAKVAAVWGTASRCHLNRGFRFNSQPLTVSFTERESVGGSAWPNVIFDDKRFDYAFVVWGNSTLGLLSFWWRSNRQQPGRGIITISSIDTLPILDLRALSDAQLTLAEEIFEEFRDKEFQPAYLADADPNRALLDRRVICDLLGFDETVYQGVRRLAAKWCAEPSVHGGKQRPIV